MGRKKIYTEEELKERKREQNRSGQRRFRKQNPYYYKKYIEENPDYYKKYNRATTIKEYNKTPIGRAVYLVNRYKQSDIKHNRGECTLTSQWVIENIFPKPCHYCGETGWDIMGCDRIDNSKPHIPDNVVPCCKDCNKKRGKMNYDDFLSKIMEN